MNEIKLFNKSDLGRRWGITRQNVRNRSIRHEDFPKPCATVENGRMELFALEEVRAYEKRRGIKPKHTGGME